MADEMQLDDLKAAWAAHDAMLTRSLVINERLLRETLLGKVRVAMVPYVRWRMLEVALGIAVLAVVMPLLAAHMRDPRYAVIGGAVAVFSVLITAMCTRLLVHSLRLDYGGTVTLIQREVEHIRLMEYRALKWAMLGGVVTWLPAGLLLFESLTGVAALARVNNAWLIANLAFGVTVLAVGQMLSRRYVQRADLGPRSRRLVNALSGVALQSATEHLAELAKFEEEGAAATSTAST